MKCDICGRDIRGEGCGWVSFSYSDGKVAVHPYCPEHESEVKEKVSPEAAEDLARKAGIHIEKSSFSDEKRGREERLDLRRGHARIMRSSLPGR